MELREFIKIKVEETGSQTAVSRKTGVSQGTINKIVHGDTVAELGTVQKIATAYGLPLEYFVPPINGVFLGHASTDDSMFTGNVEKPPPTISEQIGEGYSPEVKLMADYLEVKVGGKTREERLAIVEEIMADLREKYK